MPNSSVRLARYSRVSAPGFRGHPEIPGSSDFACGQFSGKSCVEVCRPGGRQRRSEVCRPAGVSDEASGQPRCRQGSTTPCHSDRQRHQAVSGACRGMPPRRASAAKRGMPPGGGQRRGEWPASVSPGQHQAMPLRSSAPPGGHQRRSEVCRPAGVSGDASGQPRCCQGSTTPMPLRSSALADANYLGVRRKGFSARGSALGVQRSRFSARDSALAVQRTLAS